MSRWRSPLFKIPSVVPCKHCAFFAVLVVASIVPIVLFLIFQKPLLASAGATAGLKD